jgi:hypothetical protein
MKHLTFAAIQPQTASTAASQPPPHSVHDAMEHGQQDPADARMRNELIPRLEKKLRADERALLDRLPREVLHTPILATVLVFVQQSVEVIGGEPTAQALSDHQSHLGHGGRGEEVLHGDVDPPDGAHASDDVSGQEALGTSRAACESSSMKLVRAAGYCGSNATAILPDFNIPRKAATKVASLSGKKATVSSPVPRWPKIAHAISFAIWFNAAYVMAC